MCHVPGRASVVCWPSPLPTSLHPALCPERLQDPTCPQAFLLWAPDGFGLQGAEQETGGGRRVKPLPPYQTAALSHLPSPLVFKCKFPFQDRDPPGLGARGGRRVTGPTAPSPRTLLLLWFPYTLVKSLLTNFKFAQIHCAIDFLLGLNEYNSKCRISILLIFF